MATVGTPVPPPIKNDWLSSAMDNPRLSPPSPGGPRKDAPISQVRTDIHPLLSGRHQLYFERLLFTGLGRRWLEPRTTTATSCITGCTSHSKSARRWCTAIAARTASWTSTSSPTNPIVSTPNPIYSTMAIAI